MRKHRQHFYPLNRGQWLAVTLWGICFSYPSVFSKGYSWPVASFQCGLHFLVGFLLAQWRASENDHPLTLVVGTSGTKKGSPEDHALFGKLHDLFKTSFPKDSAIKFEGFDCSDEQFWFYFKGAEPEAIQQALLPLIKEIPLRPGSHLLVRTGKGQTAESALPAIA
ncbi:MAG: hypothetical protein ACO1QS_14675 [Verrucomicrobiota bacterium]